MNISSHSRLGPILFVVIGFVSVVLACWMPVLLIRGYSPEVDARGATGVLSLNAPLTTGAAVVAWIGYARLKRIQRQTPTKFGRIVMAVLIVPFWVTAITGACLSPIAAGMLFPFVFECINTLLRYCGYGMA